MPRFEKLVTRRSFVGLAGLVTAAVVTPAAIGIRPRFDNAPFHVVCQWPLATGGLGLFAATQGTPTGEQLREIGEWLRVRYADEPNMVVQVFDDAAAAGTVRAGSRTGSEEDFQAAMQRQVASYLKNASTNWHALIITSDPPEVVRY